MKIAIVTDTYFPRINGVSVSTRIFAREFVLRGHEVHIHAPAYPDKTEDGEPFKITRYPSIYLAFDPEDRLAYGVIRGKKRAFLAEKYDIVHTQTPFTLGWSATMWARSAKIKVVHTYHTFYAAYLNHYFQFLPRSLKIASAREISKRYCNMCDLVVAPSLQMQEEVVSYRTRTPVVTIPTGIDLDRFNNRQPRQFRAKHNFSENEVLFLYAGRLAEEKNIDFIFGAFRRVLGCIPNCRLMIAGEGPSRKRLEDLAQEMGISLRVNFLGYIQGDELRDCYAAADLFVFASVTETQGLVLIEAMASGTPVVAVGKMGVLEIMRGERAGILVDLNEEDFCGALIKMVTDKKLYRRKKKETVLEAQKWSSKMMAGRMIEEYEKLLGQ